MDPDVQAAIIINDLDSLVHRIEALPADACYTSALLAAQHAKHHMQQGRQRLHDRAIKERFDNAHVHVHAGGPALKPDGDIR